MATNNGDIIDTAVKAGAALAALLILVVLLTAVAGVFSSEGGTDGFESWEPSADESTVLDYSVSDVPDDFAIDATTGQAVQFDGDGYVASEAPANWSDGNWSVCATAALADDANAQATYNLFSHDNASLLLEYHDGDWRAIHTVGDETATAAVDAVEPSSQSSLCAAWSDDTNELALVVDDLEDNGSLNGAQPDRQVANDWTGWVDELRLFNETLSSADATAYANDPVHPRPELDHDARYMFDEGEGETTIVHYQDINATLFNAGWTDGVEGPDLVDGEDYYLSANPLEVSIDTGSYLDGSPVAYASWHGNPGANIGISLFSQMVGVLGLLVTGVLVMAAMAVWRQFGGGRFGSR